MRKGQRMYFNSKTQTQLHYSKAQQALLTVLARCVWPVYIYHRATWDMSVGSIVLPTSRCQRNFMIHSTSHESRTRTRKRCSKLVFQASRCSAHGLEGPAVIHQDVSQVRAWISFCLRPLVQSIKRGTCGDFLMLGTKNVGVLLMWQSYRDY